MEFKTFNEAYETGETFYQMCYYERKEDYSGDKIYRNFSTKEEVDSEIQRMEKENKELFELMLETYKSHGITEENYGNCNEWNLLIGKVDFESLSKAERHLFRYNKNKVGFCYISVFERNRIREEKEEEEKWEANKEKRYEGPHGGAFASYDDLHRWKEGSGFFID